MPKDKLTAEAIRNNIAKKKGYIDWQEMCQDYLPNELKGFEDLATHKYNTQVLEEIKKEIEEVRDKKDMHPIISKQICAPYEESLSIINKHL